MAKLTEAEVAGRVLEAAGIDFTVDKRIDSYSRLLIGSDRKQKI